MTSPPPSCKGNGCHSSSSISLNYVIAPVSIIFLIIVLVIIIVTVIMKRNHGENIKSKNNHKSFTTAGMLVCHYFTASQLQLTLIYFADGDEHHNSTDLLHFEADSGAIYTSPDVNTTPNSGFSINSSTKLADLFDGECYASTYQLTNGQCHIYQEIPESAKVNSSSQNMLVSDEVIRSKPPIPLRFSSTPLTHSRFLYSMPNTPPSTAIELNSHTLPSVSPYQESMPTLFHNGTLNNISSYKYQEFKISLPGTPNFTPVSLFSIDVCDNYHNTYFQPNSSSLTMRKLFHAVDDEILRVPSAVSFLYKRHLRNKMSNLCVFQLERQGFNVTDNPDEIYSKLKYPHSVKVRNCLL